MAKSEPLKAKPKPKTKLKPRAKAKPSVNASARKKRTPDPKPRPTPMLLLPARAASLVAREKATRKASRQRRTAPAKPTAPPRWRWPIMAGYVAAGALLAAGLVVSIIQLSAPPAHPSETIPLNTAAYAELRADSTKLSSLEAAQRQAGVDVVDTAPLEQTLARIQVALESRDNASAQSLLKLLRPKLGDETAKLAAATAAEATGTTPPTVAAAASADVPILLYHKPPSDFDTQMGILEQRGYTTVSLDQVAEALTGGAPLPTKPVVITFDDGFAAQLDAVDYLEAHHLKATFFIIDGGAASDYCIGANRHTNLACGDAFMSWDQVKTLDRNPLFTIASHTIDHLELPTQSAAVQQFQIIEGKRQLEQHLGHRVYDFAYPYGDFDAATLNLVHQAGFIAAVTTVPGTVQTADALLTMKRIRDTYSLP